MVLGRRLKDETAADGRQNHRAKRPERGEMSEEKAEPTG